MGLFALVKRCKSFHLRALSFVLFITVAVAAKFIANSACGGSRDTGEKDAESSKSDGNVNASKHDETKHSLEAETSTLQAQSGAEEPKLTQQNLTASDKVENGSIGVRSISGRGDGVKDRVGSVKQMDRRRSTGSDVSLVQDDGKGMSMDDSGEDDDEERGSESVTVMKENVGGIVNRVAELQAESVTNCESPTANTRKAIDPRTFGITPRDPRYHKPCKEDIPIVPHTRPFEARLESAMKRCAKKEKQKTHSPLQSAIEE